jgi:hypothetical protein
MQFVSRTSPTGTVGRAEVQEAMGRRPKSREYRSRIRTIHA